MCYQMSNEKLLVDRGGEMLGQGGVKRFLAQQLRIQLFIPGRVQWPEYELAGPICLYSESRQPTGSVAHS